MIGKKDHAEQQRSREKPLDRTRLGTDRSSAPTVCHLSKVPRQTASGRLLRGLRKSLSHTRGASEALGNPGPASSSAPRALSF
jgi:hypothetical protein